MWEFNIGFLIKLGVGSGTGNVRCATFENYVFT